MIILLKSSLGYSMFPLRLVYYHRVTQAGFDTLTCYRPNIRPPYSPVSMGITSTGGTSSEYPGYTTLKFDLELVPMG